ncbi:MAG: DUF3015 domain-containing protein [Gammaproteobacteria bacterium]|nr:DUF3015 domain-containing protein [Gammaproteobacteria bacterium]MDH5620357.1 DUF3015 domain-containing protein [Gammaproteobacteria bacterium]
MTKVQTTTMLLSTAALLFIGSANAREFADIYTDCGLGAMIAPNNDAVAAVTNVTWDLGTTAISSNASSPETCEGGQGSSAAFIFDAYPSIEKDLAVGSGEHLTAMLSIAGVEESARADLTTQLRADFAELVAIEGYSEQTRYEKAENLYTLLYRQIS